ASRIGNRPMLESRSMTEVEDLYRSRQPYYRRAHITIDTTGIGADQVVARILTALRAAHAVRAWPSPRRRAAPLPRRDGHLALLGRGVARRVLRRPQPEQSSGRPVDPRRLH